MPVKAMVWRHNANRRNQHAAPSIASQRAPAVRGDRDRLGPDLDDHQDPRAKRVAAVDHGDPFRHRHGGAGRAAVRARRDDRAAPRRSARDLRQFDISHGGVFDAGRIRAAIRRRRPLDRPRLHDAALGDARRLAVPGRANDAIAFAGNGDWPGRPRRHVQSTRLQLGRRQHPGRKRLHPAGRMCWAVSIVYVRAHRWISTPFQLGFWQTCSPRWWSPCWRF